MNQKQIFIFAAICAFLLGIPACTMPGDDPPSPEVEVTITTKPASPLPTDTKMVTATSLPTLDPDDPLTFGGAATATATFTQAPTKTPLPSLPDFDDTISFSVGGGGGQCPGLDQEPNSIDMFQHDQAITTCFWLSGFDFTQPFQIVLSQANGSGNRLITPNLYLDSRNDVVQWDGYSELPGSGHWGRKNNGTLAVYNFNVWSPDRLSPGQWRFTISQKGSAFYEYTSDFWVDKDDRRPYITVLNEQFNELLPFDGGMWVRSISPKSNGKLDVRGVDFPPNTDIHPFVQ